MEDRPGSNSENSFRRKKGDRLMFSSVFENPVSDSTSSNHVSNDDRVTRTRHDESHPPSTDEVGGADKVSLRALWLTFGSSTSLHGVSKIQESHQLFGRIVWCFLFFSMLAATGYLLIDLLLSYWQYPFTSVWNLHVSGYINLPTITICPRNVYNYNKINKSVAARNFFSGRWWMDIDLIKSQEMLDSTFSELYEQYGFSADELFVQMVIYQGKNRLKVNTSFLSFDLYDSGVCFVLNHFTNKHNTLPQRISSDAILEVEMDLQRDLISPEHFDRGLTLHIHKFGTSVASTRALLISPGFTTYILFSQTDYSFLPPPYKSFGTEGCVDLINGEFRSSLRKYPLYTRDNCLAELTEELSAKSCGCVDNFENVYGVKECTLRERILCVYGVKSEIAANLTTDGWNYAKATCPYSCNYSAIETSASTMPFSYDLRPNSSSQQQDYVHLVFQPKTTNLEMVQHEPELPLDKVVATVGGYMGLFLGASLLTTAEFIEILVLTIKELIRITVIKRLRMLFKSTKN